MKYKVIISADDPGELFPILKGFDAYNIISTLLSD